jgi:hypothetical protein
MEQLTMNVSNSPALTEAHRSHRAALAAHTASAAAFERAKRLESDAQARLTQLHQAATDAERAYGDQLAAAIAKGNKSAATLPPLETDNHRSVEMESARFHATISANAAMSLETRHAQATSELREAESKLEDAAHAQIDSEALALAEKIIDFEKQAVSLREQLFGLDTAFHGLNSRPDQAWRTPTRVTIALSEPGMFDGPRYAPGMQAINGPHVARIEQARAEWLDRLAQLMTGVTDSSKAA